ncbi:MAG: phosphoenolpyruvate--protein phosphotransferase, partial [Lachnospiraceae bacterium]|nr:phosphoenolpyruvate--protein phosphotransferase [Lachnospiraceae bacterium]
MITLTGKRVSEGIAIGKISFYKRDQKDIRKISVKDVEKEVSRYIKAKERAISELDELYLMATRDVGDANAMIFETQKKLIEDPDISDEIQKRILNEEINAEFIIQEIIDSYISDTKKRGKDSLATHEADVRDAFTRLIRILQHTFKERIIYDEPFVMAADEIYPSEILQFDKSKILGFITTAGTLNSHTSVLARTKGIPSIIGVGESLKEEYDGKSVIIDGFTGKIYIEPDYTTLTKFRKKRDSNLNYRKNLEKLKGKENVTQSGQRIAVLANVANREDIESVLRSDAGGIGLYRTEFLFMEN